MIHQGGNDGFWCVRRWAEQRDKNLVYSTKRLFFENTSAGFWTCNFRAKTVHQRHLWSKHSHTLTLTRVSACNRCQPPHHFGDKVLTKRSRFQQELARGYIPICHIRQKKNTHPFNIVHCSEPPIIRVCWRDKERDRVTNRKREIGDRKRIKRESGSVCLCVCACAAVS